MRLRALIFDVDGTLAETEEVHRHAFNRAFADAAIGWHWDRQHYQKLLAVSGGKERIRHYLTEDDPAQAKRKGLDNWIAGLHRAKSAHYGAMMASGEVALRPGVERLIHEARQANVRLAIATTTRMANVTALFGATLGLDVLDWFEVIGAAEQAPLKKPDPAVYLWVLQRLELPGTDCLAIEDTRNGVQAASRAGIPVLVTRSRYSEGEDFSGALAVLSDLGEPAQPGQILTGTEDSPGWVDLDRLQQWLAP